MSVKETHEGSILNEILIKANYATMTDLDA